MSRSLSTITINIGKSGLNGNVIDEIKRQLKDREVVKIRF
jgi:RNA-binding protein